MNREDDVAAPSSTEDDEAFETRWRHRFEERARRFDDEAAIAGWSRTGLDGRFRRFRSLWQPASRAGLWLDAGCGAGTYARYLHDCGCETVGMDYSVPSLVRARSMSGPGMAWFAADVRCMPVAPGALDGVLCFGVMQALSEPRAALGQLVSSVRPGGEIWVDGLNRWCVPTLLRESIRVLQGRRPHLRYDGPARLRNALVAAGADTVRIHWLPLAPGRWPSVQALLESGIAVRLFRRVPFLGCLLSHSFLLQGTRAAAQER